MLPIKCAKSHLADGSDSDDSWQLGQFRTCRKDLQLILAIAAIGKSIAPELDPLHELSDAD